MGVTLQRFERSELALGNVNRTLAQFAREVSAAARMPVLHPSAVMAPRAGTAAAALPTSRIEDTLARFMSIADEFTFALLVEVTESLLPHDQRIGVLWERYVERETDTWKQRFASWENLHQISVPTFPHYSALLGYIEARNAVVHGLGSLTRKQLKNTPRTVGLLRSARIEVVSNQLRLTAADVTTCASVLGDFIGWLDQAAAALQPQRTSQRQR